MDKKLAIIALSIFLLLPNPLFADTTHVVISQVQVAGPAGAADEWIELYNPTAAAIDLSSYSIQSKTATGTTILKKNFASGASIPAHGYYLIAHSSAQLSVTPDMSHSTFSLSANGGNIFLVENTTLLTNFNSSSIVDKVSYGTGNTPEGTAAPAPPTSQTIERKPGSTQGNGTDTDNNGNDFAINTLPVPHNTTSAIQPALPTATPSENSTASSTPASSTESTSSSSTTTSETTSSSTSSSAETSSSSSTTSSSPSTTATTQNESTTAQSQTSQPPSIVFNELLPHPAEGEQEWIELFASASGTNLTGWTIEDGVGVIATLDQTMTASFAVVELTSSKLNNSGDTLALKNPSGTIMDRMTYGSWDDGNKNDNAPTVSQGITLGRFPDGRDTGNDATDWFATKNPTKNSANSIATTDPPAPVTEIVARTIVQEAPAPLPRVLINEFVSDPADAEQEWVELVNLENNAVDLTGWILEDGSAAVTPLSGRLGSMDNDRYLIILSPKGSLNNSGDAIVLRNATKQEVDRVQYGDWSTGDAKNAPVARDPYSVARIIDGFRSGNFSRDFLVTSTPTRGKSNRITSPEKTSDGSTAVVATSTKTVAPKIPTFLLSEILPDPIGEDRDNEWIELYNPADVVQTLEGTVIELNNGARHLLQSHSIAPKSFVMIAAAELPPLPNNGTTIHLIKREKNDTGRMVEKELDRVQVPASVREDTSYALSSEGEWLWTTTTTVASANVITPPNRPPIAIIGAPRQAQQEATILFDASDSFDPNGDALTYQWVFSDGSTATGVSVEKSFARARGTSATLSVSDGIHTDSVRQTIKILGVDVVAGDDNIENKTTTPATAKKSTTTKRTTTTSTVSITGVVSAPPSVFAYKSLYLSDGELPVRLSANQPWKDFSVGDIIELEGKTSNTTQGTVLRVSKPAQIKIVGHQNPPTPDAVTVSEALGSDIGALVTISANVRDIRAKTWLVEDTDNELVVVPPAGLKQKPLEGDTVKLTGVLDRSSAGVRLYARFPSDVVLPPADPTRAPRSVTIPTPERSNAPLMVFGVLLAAALAVLIVREPKPIPIPVQIQEPEPIIGNDGGLQLPSSFQRE